MVHPNLDFQDHTGRRMQVGDVYTTFDEDGTTFTYILLWIGELGRFAFVPAEDFLLYVVKGTKTEKRDWFNVQPWLQANDSTFLGNAFERLVALMPSLNVAVL